MANSPQRSFASGELAPVLWARTDQARYATGLRVCRNHIVLRSGGLSNRPGTVYLGTTPGVSRLLPFIFNAATGQRYVLEFTHHQLRFARDGAYVGAPYAVVTPYDAADLAGLQIAQSADVVTITHPNYPPYDLKRLAETNWTMTAITFAPTLSAPVLTESASSASGFAWVVTALAQETYEESLPSNAVEAAVDTNNVLTWSEIALAFEYNIYKSVGGGAFGFIGVSSADALQFTDTGLTPDLVTRPPQSRNPFEAGNNPGAVGYFQGRKLFGGSTLNPETVWGSRSGVFENFTVSSPIQDDDAITFALAGSRVNLVRSFAKANRALLVFGSDSEWVVTGDAAGVIRPTDINADDPTANGASILPPIKIDKRVLYVQANGSIVRDFFGDYLGWHGTDLTLFSTHLFDGHTIVDWAYQRTPHSIVWCVRDDGVLLGLTNIDDQQMLAWHRHDTDGAVENVCVIPEGTEDALYLVVRRTVNGAAHRYLERMASRTFAHVADAVLMDAALSYDGRNTDPAQTVVLGGGPTWAYDEEGSIFTFPGGYFTPGDVGNEYWVTGPDGTVIRYRLTEYVASDTMRGFPDKTVPESMRSVHLTTYARAVNVLSGLDHLEGKAVSVFADGFVVASPNNPDLDPIVVSGGAITLPRPFSYVHVGLPYTSDVETLDMDTPQGPSLKEIKINVTKVWMMVDRSRGIFAGPSAPVDDSTTGLREYKARTAEDGYDLPVALATDTIEIAIDANWESKGRVFLRQVDPVPLTILSLIPTGFIP